MWRQPQPNPSPSPRASSSLLPSRPSQPRGLRRPRWPAARPTHACGDASSAKQQGAGAGTEQKKLDRNALSACGDSARATASQAHDDCELNPQELSSLCSAARAIAREVYSARRVDSPKDRLHPLIIDGRDCGPKHGSLPVLGNSRAARLLDKDPRAFGAAVKQLYLSGSAGGAGLRELLEPNESMETDQPEFYPGMPAPASSSGSATPTYGRGARDAVG